MKKFSLIFRYACGALVALVALAFAVLEATLLVTLDFMLYENPPIAFLQLALRLLIAVFALALGICSLVKSKRTLLPHSLCLLASTAVMIPFVSNGVALCFTAVSALFLLSQLLLWHGLGGMVCDRA